ncbi:serine hydrolase [bacterium SCSIO 12741]|nr:serine hydrolase [bacterium SCSIO 12741]
MKTKLFSLLILILCTVSSKAQMSAYLADTLSALFHQRASSLQMKGIGAAIVFPDGSIWTDSHGKQGTKDLTPDLLYDIGSNTKSMTAAAMLLLVEDGKVTLDDTIGQYLPAINHVRGDITIRQLLEHTSGMYSYTEHPNFVPWLNANWANPLPSDSILPRFLQQPDFAPGTDWSYSNSGYVAAAMIIEKASGKSYHQFLRERIFDPLGLEDTYLAHYENYTKDYSGVWFPDGSFDDKVPVAMLTSAWSAGGVIATPADFAKWCHQLFGGQLLSQKSFDQLTDTKVRPNGWNYGLGIIKSRILGREYYGHGGTTLQHSAMQYSVESDFSVATIGLEADKSNQPVIMASILIGLMESELPNVPRTFLSTDGAEKEREFEARIYPMPATEQVFIETAAPAHIEVSVYSTSGALVLEAESESGTLQLLQSEIGSGLFIAEIQNKETGEILHQRILFK